MSLKFDFRYEKKNLYGIKTMKPVCYPPQTLLEGMPYERGVSGLQKHLERIYEAEYNLWLEGMTQGENRE